MITCHQCGRENADDARFCSSCGAAFAFWRSVGAAGYVREGEELLAEAG
jgi:uncharacterized membrane protein YvbJ